MDGMVIAGDAAGLTINTGLTVRGMDLAVASGIAAAVGIGASLDRKNPSMVGLAGYREAFFASNAGKDMRTYAKAPSFLEVERMYKDYGELIGNVLYGSSTLTTSLASMSYRSHAWRSKSHRSKSGTSSATASRGYAHCETTLCPGTLGKEPFRARRR